MPLNPDKLFKPIRKLRKLVKKMPGAPSPEQVHDVRTNCRKLEAIQHALKFDQTKKGRRLLKSIKPIRRNAGKVRDMDVLTGLVTTIPDSEKNESCVQLLEHLGASRFRLAKKLCGAVDPVRKKARSQLRRFSAYLNKQFKMQRQDGAEASRFTYPPAISLALSASLAAWPKIDGRSLHPYRLKVKQLRYVLCLAANPEQTMVEALGEVKDSIGEWHDWCELESIAADVIGDDRETRQQIHAIAEEKFSRAMAVTARMHARYFVSEGQQGRKQRGPVPLKRPILDAAAKMTA